jgi:mlo protein
MLLQYLKKKNQKPLYEALQKIKEGHHSHLHSSVSLYYNLYGFWVYIYIYFIFFWVNAELMLLGFISLLLTVFQARIAKICISEDLASKWLPCKIQKDESSTTAHFQAFFNSFLPGTARRLLAEGSVSTGYCSTKVRFNFFFIFIFSNLFSAICSSTLP